MNFYLLLKMIKQDNNKLWLLVGKINISKHDFFLNFFLFLMYIDEILFFQQKICSFLESGA